MDSTPDRTLSAEERARIVRRMRAVARLLDDAFRVPLTNFRVGIDPIMGLVPVLGGAISTAISGYTLWGAHRLGYSKGTLLKMTGNLVVDWGIGTVPIVGDLVDFFLKANQRNIGLLNLDDEPRGEDPITSPALDENRGE